MNDLLLVLDLIAIVLAVLLAAMAWGAARRYRDPRFALMGTALAVLGSAAAVAATDVLLAGGIPGGELGTVPVLLLIASESLLYVALVAARPSAHRPPTS